MTGHVWRHGSIALVNAMKESAWKREGLSEDLCLALSTYCVQEGLQKAEEGFTIDPVQLEGFHDWLSQKHPELVGFKASLALIRWINKQAPYLTATGEGRRAKVTLHLEAFEANHQELLDAAAAEKGIPFDLDPSTKAANVPPIEPMTVPAAAASTSTATTTDITNGDASPSTNPAKNDDDAADILLPLVSSASTDASPDTPAPGLETQGSNASAATSVKSGGATSSGGKQAQHTNGGPAEGKKGPVIQQPAPKGQRQQLQQQQWSKQNSGGGKRGGGGGGQYGGRGGGRGYGGDKGYAPPPPSGPRIKFPDRPIPIMLVQTDSDVQKAIQHLEIASKDSGLGVMCLGELTKSGSICFTLVCTQSNHGQGGLCYLFELSAMHVNNGAPLPKAQQQRNQAIVNASAPASGLRQLLTDPNIMKVMFDCRREVQTLLYAHSIPLVNVMDLKVLHGYKTQLHYQAGSGPSVEDTCPETLSELLEVYCIPLPPYSQVADPDLLLEKDSTSWASRPLRDLVPALGILGHMTSSMVPACKEIHKDLEAFPYHSAVALLSRAYAEWFLETADKGRVSWPAVQGFREAATRARDVDLVMEHPDIDPGSSLAAQLSVLRKPNFSPYMGAYGIPEDQMGWGKTGLPEPDDTYEVAALIARLPPALRKTCLRAMHATDAMKKAVDTISAELEGIPMEDNTNNDDGGGGFGGGGMEGFVDGGGFGGSGGFGGGGHDLNEGFAPADPWKPYKGNDNNDNDKKVHDDGGTDGVHDDTAGVHEDGVVGNMSSGGHVDGDEGHNGVTADAQDGLHDGDGAEDKDENKGEGDGHDNNDDDNNNNNNNNGNNNAADEEATEGFANAQGGGSDDDVEGPPSAPKGGVPAPKLTEIVIDQGRQLTLRYSNDEEMRCRADCNVQEALRYLTGVEGSDPFHFDDRMGVDKTLHRIAAIRDRDTSVIGLTYRIGRHLPGVCELIIDLLADIAVGHAQRAAMPIWSMDDDEHGGALQPSLLILGPPGVGKTTLLRDVAHCFATRFKKRTIVVDTSNEIGGDGSVPHACIGDARRMPIPSNKEQHEILLRAVQNHNPQVLVVDEIGTYKEVSTVRSIAQRGVVMVGTAHGTSLSSILKNPEMNPLVGGVHAVVQGDAAARQAKDHKKTLMERKGAPTFSMLIEILSYNTWRIHTDVAASVDAMLAGRTPATQVRRWEHCKRVVRFTGGDNEQEGGMAGIAQPLKRSFMDDLFQMCRGYASARGA